MKALYKIHTIERFDTVVLPFVVTTVFSNPGGYPKGEWFLAIPDEASTFIGGQVNFDKRSFEESPIKLDEEFVLDEVLGQAENAYRQYVFDKYRDIALLNTMSVPKPIEAERKLLVHYWLRNKCLDQLQAIKRHTQCVPLQEYLEQVVDLEPLVLRDVRI